MLIAEQHLTEVAEAMCRSKHVYGATIAIAQEGRDPIAAGAGELRYDQRFFAASVTKMVVTIAVMQMVEAGAIGLDDPMAKHLPSALIADLHVHDGVDRSGEITIRHLLANQSGLRDYFSVKGPDGRSSMDALMAGADDEWPLERTLEHVRGHEPLFVPGQKGKVDYSDTNYQLLGRVLETVSGTPIAELFARTVFEPLGLRDTYIYTDTDDSSPALFRAGSKIICVPRYIRSVSVEGGVVSTATELLAIIEAFFAGRFFDVDGFLAQQDWRLIFWPGQFYFGLGLEKLWTPWFISPIRPIRNVMGFWGHVGAFAFHHADTGLHFAGTVNQANGWGHAKAVRAMLRLIALAGR